MGEAGASLGVDAAVAGAASGVEGAGGGGGGGVVDFAAGVFGRVCDACLGLRAGAGGGASTLWLELLPVMLLMALAEVLVGATPMRYLGVMPRGRGRSAGLKVSSLAWIRKRREWREEERNKPGTRMREKEI